MAEKQSETLFFSILQDSKLTGLQEALKSFGYAMIFQRAEEELDGVILQNPVKVAIVEISRGSDADEQRTKITEIKNRFPGVMVVGVISSEHPLSAKELTQAGCSHVFQSPYENDLIINQIFETAPIEVKDEDLELSALVRINILEMELSDLLPFNLYVVLPSNKKILLYRRKDQPVEEKVINKFKNHKEYNLFIKKSDLSEYQSYCSDKVENLLTEEYYSEIDRTRKIQSEMNNLMSGFFNDKLDENESEQILHNVNKIFEGIPDPHGDNREIAKHVENFANEYMTNQTHARNVAAYCALFGMSLGYNSPQALRIGGMLHDVGLLDLPDDLVAKEPEDMDEEEWAQYQLHPGAGKYTLEQKKLKLPEGVFEMVVHHHEQPDGQGYPYQLTSKDIHPFAKICAFADEFDKLTSMRMGYVKLTPKEAMLKISGLDGKKPSARYEPGFHYPIVKNFLATEDLVQAPQDVAANDAQDVVDTPIETIEEQAGFYTAINLGKVNLPEEKQLKEFFDAAIGGDEIFVKKYIDDGFNINVFDEFDRTTLIYSVVYCHHQNAERLLDAGADFMIKDKEGNCAFLHAVKMGNTKLVKVIAEKAENKDQVLNTQNKKLQAPLALAIASKNHQMVELLLSLGADAEEISDKDGIKSLEELCDIHDAKECLLSYQEFKKTQQAPEEAEKSASNKKPQENVGKVQVKDGSKPTEMDRVNGLDVNFRNKKGQTYAHIAADNGRVDMLEKFQALKGDLNAKDFSGRSPIFFACMKGHEDAINYLLNQNVRLGDRDDQGYSALIYAIQNKHQDIACKMILAGDRIDIKIKGMTPLMIAAYLGLEQVADQLIAAGLDPSATDYKAKTAYHYALSKGHEALAEKLKTAS